MEKIIIDGDDHYAALFEHLAQNAALPILIASLLTPGEHRFTNLPLLVDVSSTLSLLNVSGAQVSSEQPLCRHFADRIL